jgi:Ran GTPase-activating protein (RanGAP) involved in mRNA processing and transport
MANMRNLEVLDLSNNRIGEPGTKRLASKLFKLKELMMNFNRVGDEGLETISSNLTHLAKLELSSD